jgi:hypothetical protein
MTYHSRGLAVKKKVKCTLENAIGLTEAERELIHFGSAAFNPDRSDRWPAEIKARRTRALNNLKNATALAAQGSPTSEQRAKRLQGAIEAITGEARVLHGSGVALARRLSQVASIRDAACRTNATHAKPFAAEELARLLWKTDALDRAMQCQRSLAYRERHQARHIPHLWSKRYSGSDARKIDTLVPTKKSWEITQRAPSSAELLQESLAGRSEVDQQKILDAWGNFEREHPEWSATTHVCSVEPAPRRSTQSFANVWNLGLAQLTHDQRRNALDALAMRMTDAWRDYVKHKRTALRRLGGRLRRVAARGTPRRARFSRHIARSLDDTNSPARRVAQWHMATRGLSYREKLHPRAHDGGGLRGATQQETSAGIERTNYKSKAYIDRLFDESERVGFLQYFHPNRSKGTT